MLPIVHLIALYFFLFGRPARDASLDYLRRVAGAMPESGLRPTWRIAYRHFRAFGTAILDKIDTWSGRLKVEDVVVRGATPTMHRLAHSRRAASWCWARTWAISKCCARSARWASA